MYDFHARIPSGKCFEVIEGFVRRSIVDNNELDRRIGLVKDRVHRPPKQGLPCS